MSITKNDLNFMARTARNIKNKGGFYLLNTIVAVSFIASTVPILDIQGMGSNNCDQAALHLSGSIVYEGNPAGNKALAVITNNSTDCAYTIGFASYKMYENYDLTGSNLNWIENQELFDSVSYTIQPGQTIATDQLSVNVPDCKYQLDLFEGPVLTPPYYGGIAKGPGHYLFDYKFSSSGLCAKPTPTPTPTTSSVPTATPTASPSSTPTLIGQCLLIINKSVDKSTASVGDVLTYTINVKNNGTADCTGGGVKITDVVDSNLDYQSQSLSGDISKGYNSSMPSYSLSTRTLAWNAHTLIPGESVQINWKGKISDFKDCGAKTVSNTAKVTAKEYANFTQWEASNTVQTLVNVTCPTPTPSKSPTPTPTPSISSEPTPTPIPGVCKLELSKTVNDKSAKVGDTLTYKLTLKNTGTANCTGSGVKIRDILDANLELLSQSHSDELAEGTYDFDPNTPDQPFWDPATRTLYWSMHILKPGESVWVKIKSEIKKPIMCGDFEVANKASATALEYGTVWIDSQIVKTSVKYPCPTPSPTPTLTPSSTPTPTPSSSPTPTPSISPTPTPSISPTPSPTPNQCQIKIEKETGRSSASRGDTIRYAISVTNTGSTDCTNVVVTDALDSRLDYQDNSASNNGQYTSNNRTITWRLEKLRPNEREVLTFRGQANVCDFDLGNEAKVSSAATALQTSNRVQTRIENCGGGGGGGGGGGSGGGGGGGGSSRPFPQFTINKIGRDLSKGETNYSSFVRTEPAHLVQFRIIVRSNAGSQAVNVRVTDILPAGFSYERGSTTVDGRAVSDDISTSSGLYLGTVNSNDQRTIQFIARIANASFFTNNTTNVQNIARVTSSNGGDNEARLPLTIQKGSTIGQVSGISTGVDTIALSIIIALLAANGYMVYGQTRFGQRRLMYAAINRHNSDPNRLNFI